MQCACEVCFHHRINPMEVSAAKQQPKMTMPEWLSYLQRIGADRAWLLNSPETTACDTEAEDPPHRCRICGITFRSAAEAVAHSDWHRGLRNCTVCRKNVPIPSFTQHMNREHGNLLPCPHCPKTFSTRKSLSRHISSHTGPFLRCACGKLFLQSQRHWQMHRCDVHTKEKHAHASQGEQNTSAGQ